MRLAMITLWIFMVVATGYALFHITFQVEALEGELAELNTQIRAEQEAIHNLRAEWSYNSRPDWIDQLGEELLPSMRRMTPDQVVRIQDIPFRRPDLETEDLEAADAYPEFDIPTRVELIPASLTGVGQ
ncbi:MAG: hypothetical protein RIM33_14285 [Alphaproteobacteria bacterium]